MTSWVIRKQIIYNFFNILCNRSRTFQDVLSNCNSQRRLTWSACEFFNPKALEKDFKIVPSTPQKNAASELQKLFDYCRSRK
jgi:hypothetical protein